MADEAIPALAEMHRQSRLRDWSPASFGWIEDSVARWRALALFGGMLVVEWALLARMVGVGHASGAGWVLLTSGMFVLFAGVLIAPALGGEYGLAILGGAAVALGVGAYLIQAPLPGSLASVWAGWTSAGPTWALPGLLFAGLLLIGVGAVESLLVARGFDAE